MTLTGDIAADLGGDNAVRLHCSTTGEGVEFICRRKRPINTVLPLHCGVLIHSSLWQVFIYVQMERIA